MADATVNKSLSKKTLNRMPNITQYISNRQHFSKEYYLKKFRKKWFDSAKNLYCKNLVAHFGCVNAIEFSNENDDLLFSGGDDRRVLVWKVDDALADRCTPTPMKTTHYSNIFCLAVDCLNRRVFSGSNDDQVLLHDYQTGGFFQRFLHESPVFCISLQPENNSVFTSASEIGRVFLYDIRQTSESICVAQLPHPFHGVMFHPTDTVLLATANSQLGIHIWDLRKPREILHHCCGEQGMAVRWNSSGTKLLCIRNLLPPLLLDLKKPEQQIEFDADSYYNACTMKSCCFAGEDDEYILSGSDDFNIHMWKIPNLPTTKWVSKAHLTLRGHRSIVNQVRYSARRQLIASSGVEKVIKLWSPYAIPNALGDRDVVADTRGRLMCSAAMCRPGRNNLGGDEGSRTVNEDRAMLHFFDTLLRKEFTDPSRPISPSVTSPTQYEVVVRRKKKLLAKTLTEVEPFVCSLRKSSGLEENGRASDSDMRAYDDLLGSPSSNSSDYRGANSSSLSPPSGVLVPYGDSSTDDSGVSHPSNSSSTTSSSSSSSSGSDSVPPAPRDSGVNLSQSSLDEEVVEFVRNRNNRSYRQRRCVARSSTDSENS